MRNTREVLVIWDDENNSYDDAIKDGAITRIELPDMTAQHQQYYINGVIEALKAAGDRISGYPQKLKFTTIQETCHSIPVEVLEWNTYHFNVWANSEEEARQTALVKGVSLGHNDVEYGTSNYFSEEKTDDRLVTK